MAGDWIKMRIGLRDDPAVVRMAAALDCDEDLIVGKLHRLWAWADQHTTDGAVSGVTVAWVNRFVALAGFAESMQSVSWLEVTSEGIKFPRFDRHNGESAKKRAENTVRKRTARQSGDKRPRNVPQFEGQTEDKSATREEKRREEKKDPEKSAGVFVELTREHLESNELLRAWFEKQANSSSPVCENTYFNWTRVLQSAEHALEVGENPVALFAANVGGGHYERGSNAADDRAKNRLKQWEQSARAGPLVKPAVSVAELMADLCSRSATEAAR